ncbi:unnamed protein product [Lasius platythorax]|uniref:Uncharacterized protein n=1 Tax=Lasius platythorax TaxID=488582 RepID=A0AAV2NR56_9HYME
MCKLLIIITKSCVSRSVLPSLKLRTRRLLDSSSKRITETKTRFSRGDSRPLHFAQYVEMARYCSTDARQFEPIQNASRAPPNSTIARGFLKQCDKRSTIR